MHVAGRAWPGSPVRDGRGPRGWGCTRRGVILPGQGSAFSHARKFRDTLTDWMMNDSRRHASGQCPRVRRAAAPYGERNGNDFFVHNLLGVGSAHSWRRRRGVELAVCVLTAWMTAYGECHPCGQPAAEPAGIRWYHSCGLVWRASTWCGELQAAGPHDRSSRHAPISPYEHRKPTGHTRPQMATMAEARGVEPWRSGRLRVAALSTAPGSSVT